MKLTKLWEASPRGWSAGSGEETRVGDYARDMYGTREVRPPNRQTEVLARAERKPKRKPGKPKWRIRPEPQGNTIDPLDMLEDIFYKHQTFY